MTKNEVKYVYTFGGKTAEGKADMKNLLGGKGANLAEMCLLGLPVPAGLTITTECCTAYYGNNCQLPASLMDEVWAGMKNVESVMGLKYDDAENPLLVSCRSGARSSMPGMMDTVLNIGLSSKTIPGLIKKTNNPRFVYDSYRRLIMMYADVVMEKAEGIEPADGKGIRKILDDMLDEFKHSKGYKSDTDITADELLELANAFKAKVKEVLGTEFPDDAKAQLEAVVPERQQTVVEEIRSQHEKIFEAVKNGNGEFAYFYMKEHLLFLKQSYEEYFSIFKEGDK